LAAGLPAKNAALPAKKLTEAKKDGEDGYSAFCYKSEQPKVKLHFPPRKK